MSAEEFIADNFGYFVFAGMVLFAWLLLCFSFRTRVEKCCKCKVVITHETGVHREKIGCLEDLEWRSYCNECWHGDTSHELHFF